MASFLEVAVVAAVVVAADGRFIDTALSILSIPFKIAFNTLLMNKILKKL